MDVTIIDADNERYDPRVVARKKQQDGFVIEVEHSQQVSFTSGERVEIVLASETYDTSASTTQLKKRDAIETVSAHCLGKTADNMTQWFITNRKAVNHVINAEVRAESHRH